MSSRCSRVGCENEPAARGLCNAHYQDWRRHGDPDAELAAIRADAAAQLVLLEKRRAELLPDQDDAEVLSELVWIDSSLTAARRVLAGSIPNPLGEAA
jgi:hypothetical protein